MSTFSFNLNRVLGQEALKAVQVFYIVFLAEVIVLPPCNSVCLAKGMHFDSDFSFSIPQSKLTSGFVIFVELPDIATMSLAFLAFSLKIKNFKFLSFSFYAIFIIQALFTWH